MCVSWGHPAYLALPENDNITIYGKAFMAAIRHNYLRNILSFVCFHIRLSYLYFFKEKKKHSSLEKALEERGVGGLLNILQMPELEYNN